MSEQVANGGKINEEGYARWLYTLFTPGVGSALDKDAWKVVQRAAGANMSADVTLGNGYIDISTAYGYWAWIASAAKNVSVDAADPSNPRKDILVAYIDLSVISTSLTNNTGALKFKAVAGTPAGSPSDPSAGTIQSAVGASNPYIRLARIAVAAGATSISDANITDLRVPIALRAPVAPRILSISASTVLSWGYDFVNVDASGGARTATLPDATLFSGGKITIRKTDATNVVTIATTSSQTIAHPGGSAPTQTALISQYDYLELVSDGTNWIVNRDGRSMSLISASRTTAFTTTSSSDTVSGAQITTLTPLTATIPAGVKYEVVLYCVQFYNNQAGNTSQLEIWDGDNTGAGTKILQGNHTQVTGVTGQGPVYMKTTPQAALSANTSKSFYFTAHAPAGSTTTTFNAGTGAPAYAEIRIIK